MASFCVRNKYKAQEVIRNEINLQENSFVIITGITTWRSFIFMELVQCGKLFQETN